MSVSKLWGIIGGIFGLLLLMSGTAHAAVLSSNNITVNESASIATFEFSIDEQTQEGFTFHYQTFDGTAKATKDYIATGGDATILPGDSSVTIEIPLKPDSIDEPNEAFRIEVSNLPEGTETNSSSWTATIIDNDEPKPEVEAPPPVTLAVPPDTPAVPETTDTEPEEIQEPEAITAADNTDVVNEELVEETAARSAFVSSLRDPTQVSWSPSALAGSMLISLLLILLIAFPSELFNSTLQNNYEEISGWFKSPRLHKITLFLHKKVPPIISILLFAATGALINSLLSPDFGANQTSAALVLGMFITVLVCSFVFDIARHWYMHSRFKTPSRLRTHALGLVLAIFLVIMARLFNFLPGYVYGVFTAIVFFGNQPSEKEDGHGMAMFSVVLLVLAAVGWFAWIPVKEAALETGANFATLVLDASLASLWIAALCSIVFGLLPFRFSNGEHVKKWSTTGWALIYGLGLLLFVHTLLKPDQNFYGASENVAWQSVLTLFISFAVFSVLFWGYFRYRHLLRS